MPSNGTLDFGFPYGDGGLPVSDNFHGHSNTNGLYDDYFRPKKTWRDYVSNAASALLVVMVAWLVFQTIAYRWHDVKAFWHRRRMAAKYKRVKKAESEVDASDLSGGEDDVGLLEVVTSTFTADASVECTVDLGDGKPSRKVQAYVGDLEKISELPFNLAESFRRSGDMDLASLSMVDLYLKNRVKINYTDAKSVTKVVGKASETTPAMLRAAKSFHVTVLPQTTR